MHPSYDPLPWRTDPLAALAHGRSSRLV